MTEREYTTQNIEKQIAIPLKIHATLKGVNQKQFVSAAIRQAIINPNFDPFFLPAVPFENNEDQSLETSSAQAS